MTDPGGIFEKRMSVIRYDVSPYSDRYPALAGYWAGDPAEPENIIESNLFYATDLAIDHLYPKNDFKNNLETETDPGFVDMENGNFMLNPDADIFKRIDGFENVPFEKMGLIRGGNDF